MQGKAAKPAKQPAAAIQLANSDSEEDAPVQRRQSQGAAGKVQVLDDSDDEDDLEVDLSAGTKRTADKVHSLCLMPPKQAQRICHLAVSVAELAPGRVPWRKVLYS